MKSCCGCTSTISRRGDGPEGCCRSAQATGGMAACRQRSERVSEGVARVSGCLKLEMDWEMDRVSNRDGGNDAGRLGVMNPSGRVCRAISPVTRRARKLL